MTRRRSVKKLKQTRQAVSQGEEPPDGQTALRYALLGPFGALIPGKASLVGNPAADAKRAQEQLNKNQPKSPLAGQPTGLTPGQKVNAINTTPQGLLEPASTARNTLLGN